MYTRYYLNEIPVVYSCETIQNDFQKMLQGSIRKYMVRNASKTMIYIFCLEFCAVKRHPKLHCIYSFVQMTIIPGINQE